ncbi:hypothetical protein ACSBR1_014792 [Camellia fascicularis]
MDTNSNIAKGWRVLSGEDNWKGLLDPLDIDRRRQIIHYREMAQATYDNFISDKLSKYAGSNRRALSVLLSPPIVVYSLRVLPVYIYDAYADCRKTVSAAFLVLYGIALATEGWGVVASLKIYPPFAGAAIIGEQDDDTKVHQGFYSIYTSNDPRSPFTKTSARDQVLAEIRRLVEEYQNEEISITVVGHSLGAAIATLNAFDIAANGFNIPRNQPDKACPVTAFVFASPRVGDSDFKKVSSGLKNLHILRIRNALDIVPKVPFIGYKNVGEKLAINTTKSEYLKRPGNLQSWHNLEAYLHGVAGTQGSNGGFKLEVDRDIALVNKSLDALKDEYLIPDSWQVEKNKGMVQQTDGSWKLMDHEPDHLKDYFLNSWKLMDDKPDHQEDDFSIFTKAEKIMKA